MLFSEQPPSTHSLLLAACRADLLENKMRIDSPKTIQNNSDAS